MIRRVLCLGLFAAFSLNVALADEKPKQDAAKTPAVKAAAEIDLATTDLDKAAAEEGMIHKALAAEEATVAAKAEEKVEGTAEVISAAESLEDLGGDGGG